jgi:hypothetical protein
LKYFFFAALCESFAAFAVKQSRNRKVREVGRKGMQRKSDSIFKLNQPSSAHSKLLARSIQEDFFSSLLGLKTMAVQCQVIPALWIS